MLKRFSAPLVAALVLLASHAQAADLVSIEWSPTGTFERELTVPVGKFAEVCGKLTAKSAVEWNFEADTSMDFNIHYHEGKKVEFPAKLNGVSKGNGTLNVGAPQDYCWMWANKAGKDARLRLALKRG